MVASNVRATAPTSRGRSRRGLTPIERYAGGYDVLVTYIGPDAACAEPSGYERGKRRGGSPVITHCKCQDCRRAWLKEQHQREWRRYEAQHCYPRADRFLRWLHWHDVSGWVLEILLLYFEAMDLVMEQIAAAADEEPGSDSLPRGSFAEAIDELAAVGGRLQETPLLTEDEAVLRAQIDRYLAGKPTSLMSVDFA